MSPSDAESVFLGFAPSPASPSPSPSDSHANFQSATDQEAYRMKVESRGYPLWLPRAMEHKSGPSVALKYCLSTDRDTTYASVLPLLCVYPTAEDTGGNLETPTPFQQFEFKFGSPGKPSKQLSTDPTTATSSNTRTKEKCFIDTSRIPVEIFEQIIKNISRTDARNLRLVDKAFERGVSRALFQTVVVPFGMEIYGPLHQEQESILEIDGQDERARNAASTAKMTTQDSSWKAAFAPGLALESQHDRLHMFRQFGAHIRQFGISMEVKQEDLRKLASKIKDENHPTFWGTYDWPIAQYSRYPSRARLENIADETSTMKAAFACLTSVKHLALSVDTGVGWIRGPDTSLRSLILKHPSAVFQTLRFERSVPTTIAQRYLWELLEAAYTGAGASEKLPYAELKRLNISKNDTTALDKGKQKPHHWMPVRESLISSAREKSTSKKAHDQVQISAPTGHYEANKDRRPSSDDDEDTDLDEHLISSVRAQGDPAWSNKKVDKHNLVTGILLVEPGFKSSGSPSKRHKHFDRKVIPKTLTEAQREWLMESAWAQDAFLSSYILAVESFNQVQILTLSRLSSRFIPKFLRHDFWKALGTLSNLTICVIADWLDLEKGEAGYTTCRQILPTDALKPYQMLLSDFIAHQPKITTLNISWAEGGEHAEGLLARNSHLLPAPLMARESLLLAGSTAELLLPHVQHLILENCWITPDVLTEFVARHSSHKLRSLTLESVSLTGPPNPVQNAGNQPPNLIQQLNHANLLGQAANTQPPAAPIPAPPTTAVAQVVNNGANLNLTWANPHQTGPGLGAAAAVLLTQHIAAQNALNVTPEAYRQGSWPSVLRCIHAHCKRERHSGVEVTFRSCGYTYLVVKSQDETAFDHARLRLLSAKPPDTWFSEKRKVLEDSKLMLPVEDNLLGHIVCALPRREITALQMDWGLTEGWPTREFLDDDYVDDGGWGKYGEKMKDAPVYDGCYLGGSGRFSGRVLFACSADEES